MPDADEDLYAAAQSARLRAHAPYSGFRVGAALRAVDGRIFTGCNVENASYGLTVCAERVALWKAISEGEQSFLQVAIVADTPNPTPPCGACRQTLWEFAPELDVILGDLAGIVARHRLADLLPHAFDARLL